LREIPVEASGAVVPCENGVAENLRIVVIAYGRRFVFDAPKCVGPFALSEDIGISTVRWHG
jgi:hypothetical protein